MIWTIILTIGFIITIYSFCHDNNDIVSLLAPFTIGGFLFILIFIASAHVGVDVQIQHNNVKYEALCYKMETIDSDWEDFSKSDVANEIKVWNEEVYSYRYWSKSPWTNWFYNKKIADEMKIIDFNKFDLEGESEEKNES